MFIELTDHLRCTEPHAEQFLVLLPGAVERRRVLRGDLGCPVCGRVVRIEAGVADFGSGTPAAGGTALAPEAVAAFLGLGGPGGYVALTGAATGMAPALGGLLPGVRLVLVNPDAATADSETASVLRAGRFPLKAGSLRGVVVGADGAADPAWVAAAARSVLPGLRLVVEGGAPPAGAGLELLAEAPGCWVARRTAG